MQKIAKLKKGDKVAILSPSFAAPGAWPQVYELGLSRLRDIFELEPVEFSTTKKIGATGEERARDLVSAFENPDIKAVITSIGGNDQVTYVKNLPQESFAKNPKPFFGYSDNSHFANFLWLQGIPSYYGGSIMTQFAMPQEMDSFTKEFLQKALFESGEFELRASGLAKEEFLSWDNPSALTNKIEYEKDDGWYWDGEMSVRGITWGGCLESIDEILRHNIQIPSLVDFEDIILMIETSEEIPSADYVFRVFRALGERGILERIKGIIIGRPQAWYFDKQFNFNERQEYRKKQRQTITEIARKYNTNIPIVQNMDFGHTNPQIPMPYGGTVRIDGEKKKIFAEF